MGADIGAEHIQEVFENGPEVENLTIENIQILCSFLFFSDLIFLSDSQLLARPQKKRCSPNRL